MEDYKFVNTQSEDDIKKAIEQNAETLRRLNKAIGDAFRHRRESPEAWAAWQAACDQFHARYDELEFPGGGTAAEERLAAGDMLTAQTAIIYLEIHPYVFRSQYLATRLIRRLKKLQLRPELQKRFETILAAAKERKLRKG